MKNKIMYVDLMHPFQVDWGVAKVGWGQFYFYKDGEKIHCSNELMSKEFIKEILCKMVDDCELDEKR